MIVSLIVAVSENNTIGKDNSMIWHLPADLKYFKQITSGHHIIMGRKNYESIGRPLPDRVNVVITRQSDLELEGCVVVQSLDEALDLAKQAGEQEAMVIGGGEIYTLALPLANKVYLTRVHHQFDGNVHFPELTDDWVQTTSERHSADEKNPYDYTFFVYEKR